MNKNNTKYLTIEKTNQFKGLLIILVIGGHIKGFLPSDGQDLLYVFHVASFLLLPFLFNTDYITFSNIKKIFVRCMIPYTIFFIISAIAYSFIYLKGIQYLDIIYSYFIGTSEYLKETNGFRAFWFFPALFQLILVIMIYNSLNEFWKKVFLIFVILLHLFIGILAQPHSIILQSFPMSGYIWMYIFSLGLLLKNLFKVITLNTKIFSFSIIIFIISSFLFYGNSFDLAMGIFPSIVTNPVQFLLVDIIIISAFLSLLFITQRLYILNSLGQYSLAIYLIHPFILQALNLAIKSEAYFVIVIKLFLVIVVSFITVKIIYNLKLDNYLFPRDIK